MEWINSVIVNYGYFAVALMVGLESTGLPLPGETTLVLASIYASRSNSLSIVLIVAAASAGAIIGDNIGYFVGNRFGYPLLKRYGVRIGVPDARIKLGQYLFDRYGFWVVFLGRFVALLRILAAFLAGVNRMHWTHFFIANAAGGILWSGLFGFGGYYLGALVFKAGHVVGPVLAVIAVIGFIGGGYLIRRYETQLQAEAERAMPGPLR